MPPESTAWVGRVLARHRARLSSARFDHWVVLTSVLLCASSLSIGWQLDDHLHHIIVRRDPTSPVWATCPSALDLFRFIDGQPDSLRHAWEQGGAPWHATPGLRLAFARPLAALTHMLDYRAFEAWPWVMHVHSLLWLAFFGWSAARLIRSLESGWVAGLVVLFYVLDAGHGVPAGWLANRNALMAGAFGALALRAHVAWRTGARNGPGWALGLMCLAFCSGEVAVGWLGFFAAYGWVLDPTGRRRGLRALAPLALLAIAWVGVYSVLGYGASSSGAYVDPLRSPWTFAVMAGIRAPQLLLGQLGGPPPGYVGLAGPRAELVAALASAALLTAVAVLVIPVLRRDRIARFWLLATLLAVVPVCASLPHARLMIVAGLGLAGLAACVIRFVSETASSRLLGGVAAWWLVVMGVVAPLRLPLEARMTAHVGRPSALAAASLLSFPTSLEGRTLVVVAAPEPIFMCTQLGVRLQSLDQPSPARVRCLAAVEDAAEIEREDSRTFVVRVDGGVMRGYFTNLVADPAHPPGPDWGLELSDLRLEIADRDPDGIPTALRVRFHEPIDADHDHVFVVWSPQHQGFVPFSIPPVGQTARVQGQPAFGLL